MVADRPLHSNHPSLPAACLPINIIHIRTQSTPGSHEAVVALICGDFDLTLCCVALHIEHNLQFQFLECENAFRALGDRKLVVRDVAFSRGLYAAMQRITKYIQRGLTW